MRGSYYNEIDPFAAEMLRNLIAHRAAQTATMQSER